ncbi:MAG: aspartate aminotransferase family protein [Deltaproteobacteria bacterium]|nr:aspartate aminotransferase family protein [Deltaproteobacteria bacterium]MBV8453527.1 aspartate aminotransferase family protein [Deltaproteobacteria bacterium]
MPADSIMFMRTVLAPLTIERAEGPWLYTSDGRRILDAGAGAVVVNIGQGREEVANVAATEMTRLNYIVPVWSSAARERLTARLAHWTPAGLNRFFFTSGGSEAVEAALKFAILYQKVKGRPQKHKIISRWFSYHGNTLAALSVGGSPGRRADYEHVLLQSPHIGPPYCYRCPWGKTYPGCDIDCAAALEQEIARNGADSIAAFIAEPMMGATAGAVPPVREYWPKLAEICRRYEILLIADEVMTGFGRTGKRFAVEHWNVKPDLLIGGKGLTGGYMPMGMIAADEKLVEECERAGADFMFYTYSAHPLACAIADKVLEIMEREHLVEHAAELGARLGAQLKEQLSGHPMAGDIRGTGFFWGIEIVRDKVTKEPYARDLRVTNRVIGAALKHGLFVYPTSGMAGKAGGDGVMVTPPFVIGPPEIDYIVQNLRAALDEVHATL